MTEVLAARSSELGAWPEVLA